MSFLELLEVNRDRLPARTERTVRYIERKWTDAGQPRDSERLAEFLDQTLRFCKEMELQYPSVFLLR